MLPSSPVPAVARRLRRSPRGFTLVELMISMAVGLVMLAALGIIMTRYENSKRRSTTQSDLTLGLGAISYDLDRQLRSAGSGIVQNSGAVGCRINASLNGAVILPAPAAFPAPFATVDPNVTALPLLVHPGAGAGGSDVIQVMTASAGLSESPMEVRASSVTATSLQLNNTLGIRGGDLLLLTDPLPSQCMVIQVQAGYVGGAAAAIPLAGKFFAPGIPPNLLTFGATGSTFLVDLGNEVGNVPRFQLIGVNDAQQLVGYDMLRLSNMPNDATAPVPLAEGVVDLRARYGVSTTLDGNITNWVTPGTGIFSVANMNSSNVVSQSAVQQIVAVRVAMLMRGDRIENDQVSPKTYTLFNTLPTDAQVTVTLKAGEEKRNYKVVEFTVPLRNAVVASPSRTAP